jgi:hypothetical protein
MLFRASFQHMLTDPLVPSHVGSRVAVTHILHVAQRYKCSHTTIRAAAGPLPPSELPEDIIDLRDPQLLQQINDLLKELDPDMLLVCK